MTALTSASQSMENEASNRDLAVGEPEVLAAWQ
jgi:hypothetical protein